MGQGNDGENCGESDIEDGREAWGEVGAKLLSVVRSIVLGNEHNLAFYCKGVSCIGLYHGCRRLSVGRAESRSSVILQGLSRPHCLIRRRIIIACSAFPVHIDI